MDDSLTFTEGTKVEFDSTLPGEPSIDEVHLEDLSFVLDLEHENGEITYCKIDIGVLVHVMILYSAMEQQQYDWRE